MHRQHNRQQYTSHTHTHTQNLIAHLEAVKNDISLALAHLECCIVCCMQLLTWQTADAIYYFYGRHSVKPFAYVARTQTHTI